MDEAVTRHVEALRGLQEAMGSLSAELRELIELLQGGLHQPAFNKIRFIVEAMLSGLCARYEVSLRRRPSLDSMLGDLSHTLPASVTDHLRTVQRYCNAGSHFHVQRHVGKAELSLALGAFEAVLGWWIEERPEGSYASTVALTIPGGRVARSLRSRGWFKAAILVILVASGVVGVILLAGVNVTGSGLTPRPVRVAESLRPPRTRAGPPADHPYQRERTVPRLDRSLWEPGNR